MHDYIVGPKIGYDAQRNTYEYYKCNECGLETTDPEIQNTGCWRCEGDADEGWSA